MVLSPLDVDLAAIRRVVTDTSRRHLLDQPLHRQLIAWLDDLAQQYPAGKIPVTADPGEEVRPTCNVSAHRPGATTAGELLEAARNAKRVLWL